MVHLVGAVGEAQGAGHRPVVGEGEVAADAGAGFPGYGLGWWFDRETGVISDGGAYGSLPWLDVEEGYGAYLVIEANSGLGSEMYGELAPVVESVMT